MFRNKLTQLENVSKSPNNVNFHRKRTHLGDIRLNKNEPTVARHFDVFDETFVALINASNLVEAIVAQNISKQFSFLLPYSSMTLIDFR